MKVENDTNCTDSQVEEVSCSLVVKILAQLMEFLNIVFAFIVFGNFNSFLFEGFEKRVNFSFAVIVWDLEHKFHLFQ